MSAEKAIQTFKNHFIAVRSGMDPSFPERAWHHILEHVVVTLNMLRPSKLNPKISAYMQLHGVFDFNKTPIAPAGWQTMGPDVSMLDQPSITIETTFVT